MSLTHAQPPHSKPATKSSLLRLFAIPVCSAVGALALTHLLWPFTQHTPFLLGFGAAVVSSRLGGRWAGMFAVAAGAAGFAAFPPPLPPDGFLPLLLGFVVVSSGFGWLVAAQAEAEALLRVSESRLAEAQQVAHVGSWEWNVPDGSLSWSDETYRIFGLEPGSEPASFDLFRRVLHPEDYSFVDRIIQRASDDRQPFECDYRIVRPSGEVRTVHVHGQAVLDRTGRVHRMVGTVHDITDRKKAEEATLLSERRLRTIIDTEPACVKVVSADGVLLEINRAGLAMIDAHQPSDVIGQPILALIHSDDRERYLTLHRDALRGSGGRGEFRTIGLLSGEERWVDSRAVPFDLATSSGRNQRTVLSVTSDITERVRAQQALTDAQEQLRFALEAAQVGVWDADLKAGTIYWSDTATVVHGVSREALGNSLPSFMRVIDRSDRRTVLGAIKHALREKTDLEVEYRTPRSAGTEHHIACNARFFYDEAGVPYRGAGICVDITARRMLEAQLRQSQKMEAIGLLAGGIAHDFNNLLTAIGGYAELVLGTFDQSDERRSSLQEVVKATGQAAALTRQLLAFSRQQTLQPTLLDISKMVEGLQAFLRRTLPENIELQLALTDGACTARADQVQLEQVILNLTINARDAMPAGGQLRIGTDIAQVDAAWAQRCPPMPTGRYVRMMIRDTGTGMSPETRSRIFEPFFTTKELGKGTGLGLATVYGIVKQSGGFIWVESELGRGTTFSVYLPAVDSAPVTSVAHAAPAQDLKGSREVILLAEDDAAVRRLACEVLDKHGYKVLEARDGDEALALAEWHPQLDLLVTDVVMPGLSGPELARRLTRERPSLRVLFTSGYNEHFMVRSGLQRGLLLLPKPFRPRDLLRKVQDTLRNHGSDPPHAFDVGNPS